MKAASGTLAPGKYGCVASVFHNGEYALIPRGSVVLGGSGGYTYSGFEAPSRGTYAATASGSLAFRGGYLDGGEGRKTERAGPFFLTFPSCPDNRWTCSLVD